MMCVLGVILNMPLVQITYERLLPKEDQSLRARKLYFQEWLAPLISPWRQITFGKETSLLCIVRDASVGQIGPYLSFSIVPFTENCRTFSGERDLLDSE